MNHDLKGTINPFCKTTQAFLTCSIPFQMPVNGPGKERMSNYSDTSYDAKSDDASNKLKLAKAIAHAKAIKDDVNFVYSVIWISLFELALRDAAGAEAMMEETAKVAREAASAAHLVHRVRTRLVRSTRALTASRDPLAELEDVIRTTQRLASRAACKAETASSHGDHASFSRNRLVGLKSDIELVNGFIHRVIDLETNVPEFLTSEAIIDTYATRIHLNNINQFALPKWVEQVSPNILNNLQKFESLSDLAAETTRALANINAAIEAISRL